MFYFKTVNIENTDPEVIEKAIHDFSIMKNKMPDFVDPNLNLYHKGKYFWASEDYNKLLIRRIPTLVELALPRLIVRFYKADKFTSYQIRYSYPTIAFFFIIIIQVIAELMYLLTTGKYPYQGMLFTGMFLVLIPFLTRIELRKTRNCLNEVIKNTCSGTAPEQALL